MNDTPRALSILALALAATLAGCSKREPEAAAPAATAPAASPAAEESMAVPRDESTKLPPAEQKTSAEQAQTLLQFIEDKPECQSFRAQLEQAAQAPAGQTVTLDMGQLMDEAFKAGCQKAASGG